MDQVLGIATISSILFPCQQPCGVRGDDSTLVIPNVLDCSMVELFDIRQGFPQALFKISWGYLFPGLV
jgi:hypothetical protein